MNNLQYSSGERNHYFSGKLMTVRDFESEQTYFNDKRRLGNRMLHGAGIVSGLGVLLTDNQSFSLEAGMALDYLGREIVVREPSVKRLSVIQGFEGIQGSGDVYLGIAYREELREGTFAVSGQEGGVREEFNRVREGYELFLTTRKPDPSVLGVERVLYDLCPLYDGSGVTITLRLPRFANVDGQFGVRVLFEKRDVSAPVRFSFDVESDLFRGPEGEKAIHVEYTETEVTTHKHLTLDYAMACGPVKDDYTSLRVRAEGFSLRIGSQEESRVAEDLTRPVEVTARPLREVAADAYFARHFDEMLTATEDQAIYLAKFHVVANSSGCSIEEVVRNPFRQYLPSAQLLDLLQGLERTGERGGVQPGTAGPGLPVPAPSADNQVLTGVQTISLGVAPKAGKSYYSHEFIHGLGPGEICVVTAAESTPRLGDPSTLVFGEGDIFSSDKFSLAMPACSTAAMVNTERGTLQLGVKLLERQAQQSVRVRWWAWRAAGGERERREEAVGSVRVVITPNTADLEPLQQLRFTAQVEGSASQEVNWTVVERDGGAIDRNGLYTAPAGEGVFEIQAQSVKYSDSKASAYVVVSRS